MDYQDYLKFFFALIFVLCLMGGLAFIMRRFNLGQSSLLSPAERRLKIIEVLPLDARRKAMLISRDNSEHLVILSATGETVVESNIKKTVKAKKKAEEKA
ncbi:MAG: flagellar biosynthetic protein FliO [Pseudomonadota bacterium]